MLVPGSIPRIILSDSTFCILKRPAIPVLNRSKVNKTLNIFLRLLILAASFGYIGRKIFVDRETINPDAILQNLVSQPLVVPFSILLFLLMVANWSLETLKWRFLVSKVEKVDFGSACIAVLTGITVSIFTPNRVGEFFGRAFVLRKANPAKAILLTLVGSMSQLLVTVMAGSFALAFFLPGYVPFSGMWSSGMYLSVVAGMALVNIVFVLFYFNVPLLGSFSAWLAAKNWSRLSGYLRVLNDFSRTELLKVLLLSLARYVIFSVQFFLVLMLFGVPVTPLSAVLAIPVIYLALAAIPTVALSELGVRGSVALFVLGMVIPGSALNHTIEAGLSIAIVSAATALWFINLAVPALAGMLFVYRLKFVRQ